MEPLLDPRKDRRVKNVKPPPHKPLATELLFPKGVHSPPDWKLLRNHLHREGRVDKKDLIKVIEATNKILKGEGNLIYLRDPLTVVGDIHGQYYDLVKILDVGGNPDGTKYLFLGDFVDRGSFSIEVLILLYSLKITFPETIHFIRGNHECRQMTSFFNFRNECLYKYDQEVYDMFMDSFDLFPLACIINCRFLAVHGGISPDLKNVEDINLVDRFKEPPKQGIFCDLLWADPVDNDNGECEDKYKFNDVRGCSYFYGAEAASSFLEANELLTIIRAHEAQIEGYKMHKWSDSDFPLVITIFSAPNYCDVYNNKGAVIKFNNNMLNIQQFNYSPHPYLLPNFMDVFTWSIPFVAEKVIEMFYNMIKPTEDSKDDEDSDDEGKQDKGLKIIDDHKREQYKQTKLSEKASKIRNKIKFVSKMLKMQKVLREQNETIIKIKNKNNNKLPKGLLMEGPKALDAFSDARKNDLKNERRPD